MKSKIILLNGASSSGKTSIAKNLQEILDEPYFHINIDLILDMAPKKLLAVDPKPNDSATNGFYWVTQMNKHERYLQAKTGDIGVKMVNSIYSFVREIINNKVNIIIDDVFIDKNRLKTNLNSIGGNLVYLIGVHCSLEQLESREKLRKNRRVGEARGQAKYVHSGVTYDLNVDTSINSTSECAAKIANYLFDNKDPQAFKLLLERQE